MVKFYDQSYEFGNPESKYETKISMMDADTLQAAQGFEGACCLNFASHKRPGGGYESVIDLPMPIRTQEEDLFRRSNLPELMDNAEVRKHYPLKGIAGLYTDEIVVSKDNYLGSIEPFKISLVTVPSVVNPQREDVDLVIGKVNRILEIAADNKQKTLILGSWGCGIFNNDPTTIARLFKNFLDNEFKGVFETVVFAIPNSKSANYKAFESVINEII